MINVSSYCLVVLAGSVISPKPVQFCIGHRGIIKHRSNTSYSTVWSCTYQSVYYHAYMNICLYLIKGSTIFHYICTTFRLALSLLDGSECPYRPCYLKCFPYILWPYLQQRVLHINSTPSFGLIHIGQS